jgi:hypothetical protein
MTGLHLQCPLLYSCLRSNSRHAYLCFIPVYDRTVDMPTLWDAITLLAKCPYVTGGLWVAPRTGRHMYVPHYQMQVSSDSMQKIIKTRHREAGQSSKEVDAKRDTRPADYLALWIPQCKMSKRCRQSSQCKEVDEMWYTKMWDGYMDTTHRSYALYWLSLYCLDFSLFLL